MEFSSDIGVDLKGVRGIKHVWTHLDNGARNGHQCINSVLCILHVSDGEVSKLHSWGEARAGTEGENFKISFQISRPYWTAMSTTAQWQVTLHTQGWYTSAICACRMLDPTGFQPFPQYYKYVLDWNVSNWWKRRGGGMWKWIHLTIVHLNLNAMAQADKIVVFSSTKEWKHLMKIHHSIVEVDTSVWSYSHFIHDYKPLHHQYTSSIHICNFNVLLVHIRICLQICKRADPSFPCGPIVPCLLTCPPMSNKSPTRCEEPTGNVLSVLVSFLPIFPMGILYFQFQYLRFLAFVISDVPLPFSPFFLDFCSF